MAHEYRFYVDPQNVLQGQIVLEGEEYHHIYHVLRKKPGDIIQAVDGEGSYYEASIHKINRTNIIASIIKTERVANKVGLAITLILALTKGRRVEWILEKGTEIGVAVFQPILTENCQISSGTRLERWRQLTISAMKQSGRFYCPAVKEIISYSEALSAYCRQPCFIAHEGVENAAPVRVRSMILHSTECAIFIGPESGFTDAEVELALKAGAMLLNLGGHRLRSETAGFVAAIQMLNAAGDLGPGFAVPVPESE
jgi:16S rRNA (uracil1498-N3)-methyltransferase